MSAYGLITTPGPLPKDTIVLISSFTKSTSSYNVTPVEGGGSQVVVPKADIMVAKVMSPVSNYAATSEDELTLELGTDVQCFQEEEQWYVSVRTAIIVTLCRFAPRFRSA